jgi:hypothetical protein
MSSKMKAMLVFQVSLVLVITIFLVLGLLAHNLALKGLLVGAAGGFVILDLAGLVWYIRVTKS